MWLYELLRWRENLLKHICQTDLRMWNTLSPPRVIGRAHKGGDSTCSDQCHHTKWLHQGHNPLGPGYVVGSWNVHSCNNLYSGLLLWFLKVCPFVFQRTQDWTLCHPWCLGCTCFQAIPRIRRCSVPTSENAKCKWSKRYSHHIMSFLTKESS